MNFFFQRRRASTVQRLRKHQFISLRKPKHLCVRAERGTLWLTVDGDPSDIELEPGQWRRFDGSATVVIGTLGGDAVVSITPVQAVTLMSAWTWAGSVWPTWVRSWLHTQRQPHAVT